MLGRWDGEATGGGREVTRRGLLENSTGPVGRIVNMGSSVVNALDELGVFFEVGANLNQRLSPVATSAISTGLNTFSKSRGACESRASNGGGDECDGEPHVD